MMERIVFADPWEDYFCRCGLRAFAQFFYETKGLVVNKNSRRDVTKLTLDGGPPKVFFMKRFHRPHLKDGLASLRRFGRPISQAVVEWHNANYLLSNGIGTYKPLCYGEQVTWGFEHRSFLITEQLDSACLLDLVIDRWQDLDRASREALVIEMADLTCRIHARNISLPDLYVWHLFTPAAAFGHAYDLSVIDLHRMVRNVRLKSRKIKDLARLQWSMSRRYFDDGLRDLLVSTYAAGTRMNPEALARAVARYANRMEKARPVERYYRRTSPKSASEGVCEVRG
jgi:hypothetical protein